MDKCKNCNSNIIGKFCSNCGLPKEPRRIDKHYIFEEISSVVNFEKGIFYTIWEVLIRPGTSVKRFLEGDRKRIVKPIIFLIICSLIYTLGKHYLNYDTGYIKFNLEDQNKRPIVLEIFEWLSRNYGYANILIAVFIAIWIKIFFKKYNYNYYEIYVLLCFIMGISVLIYTLLGIIENIIDIPVLHVGKFIVFIYCGWAIGQFFDRTKKLNYLKGFLSYLLGLLTSLLILMTVGFGLQILFN